MTLRSPVRSRRCSVPLAAAVALAGCAAVPPPEPTPAVVAVAPTPSAEAPPPAPAVEPRPTVEIALAQYDEFASLRMPHVAFGRLDDAAVAAGLAAAQRKVFEAQLAAPAKLRALEAERHSARMKRLDCVEGDGGCRIKALEQAQERATEKLAKAAQRAIAARERAIADLEKALDAAPSAHLALALARLHAIGVELDRIATEDHPAESSQTYGDFTAENSSTASHGAELAYERAARLAPATDAAGFYARYGLAAEAWMRGDAAVARARLEAIADVAPGPLRAEIELRLGVLHGAEAADAKAAAAFRRALASAPAGDRARPAIMDAIAIAEYRAGRFPEALGASIDVIDARRSIPSRSAAFFAPTSLTTGAILRIAGDCVERLGDRADTGRATPATRAEIGATLARRAYHRSDRDEARRLAEQAIAAAPDLAEAGEAIDVLVALARDAGDMREVRDLEERRRKLPPRWSGGGPMLLGILGGGATVEQEERRLVEGRPAPGTSPGAGGQAEEAAPPVERNVRSLVRLCLEPIAHRLDHAASKGLKVVLTVRVHDGKPAEVHANAPDALVGLEECLASMGPRVFARAPSSVLARVDLTDATRPEWIAKHGAAGLSSVFGPGGAGTGLGGLGLGGTGAGRGGGGSGAGLGGLGAIGRGGGGGGAGAGYGSGAGRGSLGGAAPKKKPPAPPAPERKPAP